MKSPNTLLTYTILKNEISDTPLKTEILTDILLEKKESITENKLKILLKTLYDERKNRTGFTHHETPNTIAVYAYLTKEKANSGMGQWVAMISKTNMNDNSIPEFKINKIQLNSIAQKKESILGLSNKKRREIWKKIILAERYGSEMAHKIHPIKAGSTQEDLVIGGKLIEKWQLVRENEIIKEYKINQQILDSITLEGLTQGWAFPEYLPK
ncbi:hypothetical protein BST83_08845 [Polaribacter filamentus]|uniref:Uncharacterized protein n=1 Tax=Polaribacter filamentus TaxID=53483 RepID=A0A2S7KXP1_9FLAO|nr:hypothetical protein [Polaribacter filamentus]PQB07248.1 hypothetical protein BST83_08845 [Polaribacter filamentus]